MFGPRPFPPTNSTPPFGGGLFSRSAGTSSIPQQGVQQGTQAFSNAQGPMQGAQGGRSLLARLFGGGRRMTGATNAANMAGRAAN
ncbi:hypothetical protein, partial [Pseudomonas sp. 2822-17]|uniref:hypothetical protein n=1 Tax=Pseudomonas sp. 2822-17 TaxID=1712678 RepID=UPI001C4639CE